MLKVLKVIMMLNSGGRGNIFSSSVILVRIEWFSKVNIFEQIALFLFLVFLFVEHNLVKINTFIV